MILAFLIAQASAPALILHVDITGLRSDAGEVAVTLYNNADGYPKNPEKAARTLFAAIKNHAASIDFTDLPAGEYAIAVIHDENGNKKLDTNFLGMPKEGVGASNDAKGFMGPPKYKAAKFQFTTDGQKLIIPMHYL